MAAVLGLTLGLAVVGTTAAVPEGRAAPPGSDDRTAEPLSDRKAWPYGESRVGPEARAKRHRIARLRIDVGLRFTVREAGRIVGLRFWRGDDAQLREDDQRRGTLRSSSGEPLARVIFPAESKPGWQFARFDHPVRVRADRTYLATVSVETSKRSPSKIDWTAIGGGTIELAKLSDPARVFRIAGSDTWRTAGTGREATVQPVIRATERRTDSEPERPATPSPSPTPKSSPTPTPEPEPTPKEPTTPPKPSSSPSPTPSAGPTTPPDPDPGSTGAFPGPDNTGVPEGTDLDPYTGPMTITKAGTVIDAKEIRGRLVIEASGVMIKRSMIHGRVDSDTGSSSVTIEDTEIDAGTEQAPGAGFRNLTIRRTEIRGGQHSVLCGDNCLVEDSWLHDQALPAGSDWHNNAYLSNGGTNVVLRGNTFQCTPQDNSAGGGCTADVSFFGDFSALSDITVTGNLFKATPGGYCGTFGYNEGKRFGTSATGIVVTNNVFEPGPGGKCGYWGPVTGFALLDGNLWSGNRWLNGGLIDAIR